MTATTNGKHEKVVRGSYEAWDEQDIDAFEDVYAADVVHHVLDIDGRDELEAVAGGWFEAFPDLSHTVEATVAEGDWVCTRFKIAGTHEREFQGIEPTGETFELFGIAMERVEEEKIVERWVLEEQLDLTMESASSENEALVRRFFDAYNERDREAFVATMSEDFMYGDIEGPEEMAENEWNWIAGTDTTWEVHTVHAGESLVTARTTAQGTHRGEVLGLEPTGESFEATAIQIAHIEDGQIAEWQAEWDFAGFLNQIGAIDSPVYDE